MRFWKHQSNYNLVKRIFTPGELLNFEGVQPSLVSCEEMLLSPGMPSKSQRSKWKHLQISTLRLPASLPCPGCLCPLCSCVAPSLPGILPSSFSPAPSLEALVNHRSATTSALALCFWSAQKRGGSCVEVQKARIVFTLLAGQQSYWHCRAVIQFSSFYWNWWSINAWASIQGLVLFCMDGNSWEKVKWKSGLLLNGHHLPSLCSPALRSCPCAVYRGLRYPLFCRWRSVCRVIRVHWAAGISCSCQKPTSRLLNPHFNFIYINC